MKTEKRYLVCALDTFEDEYYDLKDFDDVDEAVAFAEEKASKPHLHASPELADQVIVVDRVKRHRIYERQKPTVGDVPVP